MKKIIILGCGGNSRDIVELIAGINAIKKSYEIVGFLDDNKSLHGKKIMNIPVMGDISTASKYLDCTFVNGIYSLNNFQENQKVVKNSGISDERYETLIHPDAQVASTAKIGKGSVIFQNTVIMSNAVIGNHVNIQPNCVISHDSSIGDFSFVSSTVAAGGYISIGRSVFVGLNSSLREKITIGDNSVIGMGSVVLVDVDADRVVAGSPAKPIKKS